MVCAEHLNENARAVLELPDEERIRKIQSPRWIGYTRAREILNSLEELLNYPKTHRMPNLLIVGVTNNGKTMVVNRFVQKHPSIDNTDGDSVSVPVLMIQAPPVSDESRFYNAILEKTFAPFRERDHVSKKQTQAISILKNINLGMLIIDEIHNLLAGHTDKQRQMLNVIRYIGNELRIPIVGVGTYDAFRALQTDPQLSNRFEPASLPKWTMNKEYLRLLDSFERMIPLKKPSGLINDSLALKLLSMSEGTIGDLSRLLIKAAAYAVAHRVEKITENLLDSVEWVRPSDRGRQI
jgi:DNA transposition AAA+ family ATPase